MATVDLPQTVVTVRLEGVPGTLTLAETGDRVPVTEFSKEALDVYIAAWGNALQVAAGNIEPPA